VLFEGVGYAGGALNTQGIPERLLLGVLNAALDVADRLVFVEPARSKSRPRQSSAIFFVDGVQEAPVF
jgi:hypothetical protein